VRLSLLLASSAVALSLALSACSGSTSAVPSGSSVSSGQMAHHLPQLKFTGIHVDTKNPCPSSKYLFCVNLYPSSSGPYVQLYNGGSVALSVYGNIVTKKGKPTKKVTQYWSPNPDQPYSYSYQYISETKALKASKKVKFVDQVWYCVYGTSSCSNTYYIGIIPA
jgi:hypothetical protein